MNLYFYQINNTKTIDFLRTKLTYYDFRLLLYCTSIYYRLTLKLSNFINIYGLNLNKFTLI